MAGTTSSRGRPGRPPRTSRAEVMTAARRIIERDGWEKLTVRRLAGEVGVSAMTIYHHVEDRGDLLVQLINDELAELPRPDLPAPPRDRIVAAGIAIRDVLAAQPWIAEVVATDGFLSRLGENAVWMVEATVAAALEAGCDAEQAILVFRHLWYYTVGEILVRANTRGRRAEDSASGPGVIFGRSGPSVGDRDPELFPALAAVGAQWAEVAARDTFADGLRAFVDGLLDAA